MDDNLRRTLQVSVSSEQTTSTPKVKENEAAHTSEQNQNLPVILGAAGAVLIILAALLYIFWMKRKRDAPGSQENNFKHKDLATKMTTTPHDVIPTLSATATSYRDINENKKWNGQKSTASTAQEMQSSLVHVQSGAGRTLDTKYGHPQRFRDAKEIPVAAKPSWIADFTSHQPSALSPRVSSVSSMNATPNYLGATQIAMAAAINAGVHVGGEEFKLHLDHDVDDQGLSDDDEYFFDRPGSIASDRFSSIKLDQDRMSERDSSVYHQSTSFCSDVFSVRSSVTNDDADIYEGSLSFSVTEGRPSTRLSTEF